jgi:hypothetical protein
MVPATRGLTARSAVLIAFAAVLASCTSAGTGHPAVASPIVVDGITVPPPYVAPVGTVVPGPSSCPTTFAATLSSAAHGLGYTLDPQLSWHLLSCAYRAVQAPPPGDCKAAKIIVNTEPQAFKAFDRWNVETGQNAMWTNNPALQPTPIAGIGIEAEWAPALLELGTGNDTAWVSVILSCPANTPPVLELAKQLAVQGLEAAAR